MKKPASSKGLGKLNTVTWDAETAYNEGAYFGRSYDVHIAHIINKGFVLGFAWKQLGKKKIHTCYIWDFPLYKKEPRNDINVIKKWVEVMESNDVEVGWNNIRFDTRVMYGRLLKHKLPPPTLPKPVDVMRELKKLAAYDSYKLDDVSEEWGHGHKIKTEIGLWVDCVAGVKSAQKKMEKYNRRDVEVTELDYLDLRPHIKNHPNVANIIGLPKACPKCGTEARMLFQGYRPTKTGMNRVVQCTNCWGKSTLRKGEKNERPEYI